MDIFARPIAPIYGIENETLAYLSATNGAGKTKAQIAAIDLNIKAIKYTPEGLTLSSVTGKWSLVSGTSFGTGFSQDLRWLSFLQGIQIVANDGTNSMTIIPTYLGYGTGETLGDETFVDVGFADAGSWSVTGTNPTWVVTGGKASVTNSSSGASNRILQNVGGNLGTLFKVGGTVDVLSSGAICVTVSGITGNSPNITTTGSFNRYIVKSVNTSSIGFRCSFAGTTVQIDDVSCKQVLTPSSSGFVWTATSVGSFNANAAAFTLTITRIQ